MEFDQRKGRGAVRLSIPAKVAYNADAFQKSMYNLLDELGCPKCFSGVDCYFETLRDYVLDSQENVVPTSLASAEVQQIQLGKTLATKTLNVGVSSNVSFDIGKIDSAIKNIFEEIGCRACCSGHDIFFQNQFDFNF
ncbi:hypothetical protein J8281_07045 [Aquimarina sp. U1-2]|uniref:hypothetical protein n=1 Tax=Aquimarina sp. U1-2 TaxID=2823141 RepID=UPI001AEC9196|nr:hypothetical protein [Aquimarina sp. U1-2]MBP2831942.1 hypothetical protein [Aquimarina sp. U1-2]